MTLTLDFHKTNDPSISIQPYFTYRSEVFTLFNANNIDAMLSAAYNTLLQAISKYRSNGSRWVVDHFIDVSLGNYECLKTFWWCIIDSNNFNNNNIFYDNHYVFITCIL